MSTRHCSHGELQVDMSSHAAEAGVTRPTLAKRLAAATTSGSVSRVQAQTTDENMEYTFPGPLVLPQDDLTWEKEPLQSLRSWTNETFRNPFTNKRKTLYVAPPPSITSDVSFMKVWIKPLTQSGTATSKKTAPPKVSDVREYLEAFYHPLEVKELPNALSFVKWEKDSSTNPSYVGLHDGKAVTRVRTRACPDQSFSHQLNLNDILDVAIESLLTDAYAIVFLINHDLYDADEDDFCCGMAYGGSRVCTVSSTRYHPALDDDDDGSVAAYPDPRSIERGHMWPASHCRAYVDGILRGKDGQDEETTPGTKPTVRKRKRTQQPEVVDLERPETIDATPLGAAVKAVRTVDPKSDLYGLWLSRVARTVAHELGHCLCFGHCSYYACSMQSTAGVAEDVRQPPYLCPVCLKKLTTAIRQVNRGLREEQLVVDRYTTLLEFCKRFPQVGMFVGFRAWLEKRIESL
ncbi:hypothetical protein B0H63DRAFT_464425 [Podospora didyma]|uniref:Archaemetzincin-2 n=1 Tax=Podospora didyma TaxID=330526 RepID=A0AAE0NY30_9PEZI|nr:hypothetical protein B0H63DRAFT_464425 [Podospora didyma]